METVILAAGAFVFLAHLLDIVFERTRVPDILLLMVLGVLCGPVSGLVPLSALGQVGDFLAVVTLVVILTESGISLQLKTLVNAAGRATPFALLSMGGAVAIMAWLLSVFVLPSFASPHGHPVPPWMMVPVDPWTAWLGAFILGGTSSAVVIPMLKGLKCSDGLGTTLTIESALTDVLCIIAAVSIASALAGGADVRTGGLLGNALFSLSVAAVIGAIAAFSWTVLVAMTDRMTNTMFTTLAFAMVIYGVAELLGVSGAIAALVFGVTLGNLPAKTILRVGRADDDGSERIIRLREVSGVEKQVYAETVFLLKAFFFFYLGLTVRPMDFFSVLGLAALLLALAPFIPRWLTVCLFLNRKTTTRREALIAWALVPRGLAAAVLAQIPVRLGIPGGEVLATTVAMMVFLSILAVAVIVFLTERGALDAFSARAFALFPPQLGDGEPAAPVAPSAPAEPAEPSVGATGPVISSGNEEPAAAATASPFLPGLGDPEADDGG